MVERERDLDFEKRGGKGCGALRDFNDSGSKGFSKTATE
jgi:hypothetical protein